MSTGNGAPKSRPLVSLIAPALNEAENAAGLVQFFREIRLAHPGLDFELIVIDDGSTDDTVKQVLAALGDDDTARVASLSRNFGSHAALSAGFALCRGDAALTISTDLQEPLEAIGRYLEAWQAGHDIVWGLRKTRAVPKGFGNFLSRRFSAVFNRMSEIPGYPKQGPSQVLISRRVVDVLNQLPERNRNILGMVAWVGFPQTSIEFEQLPRPAGKSKWTTGKKIRLVVDSFVQFSSAPFLIAFLMGLAICGIGFLLGLGLLIAALVTWSAPVGWALVIACVFLLGGLNLSALGGFGEYLWRAGDDARRRPVYVMQSVHDVGTTLQAREHVAARAAN